MKMSSLKGTLAFLLFVGVCFSAKLTFRPLDESKNFETEVTVTDEHGTGVAFDGIGGISGGGVSCEKVYFFIKCCYLVFLGFFSQ